MPLSKECLLSRNNCCFNHCLNCPYKDKNGLLFREGLYKWYTNGYDVPVHATKIAGVQLEKVYLNIKDSLTCIPLEECERID